jgi:crotonobetainyl-CoA:carnitine CoA-transferase CaiB-like acyl-CoA transferase
MRFASLTERRENRIALDEFVGTLVRERNAEELTAALQAVGVGAYPVQSCMDLHRDENLEAFGFWHWLEHEHMGASPYEGLQHRMSRTPGDLRAPAPTLGQHNQKVLGEMFKMSAAEIEQLKQDKVIY